MLKEKMKHIILIVVAIAFIGIGYLNFDYDDAIEVASVSENESDESNLGDVELVNANSVSLEEAIVPNDDNQDTISTVNNSDIDEYFSETKLDREKMYSQMLETYQNMVNSKEISNDQKAIAIQEINNITTVRNGIMIAENLIKNKGFENVVILVSNNTASVIVKAGTLSSEQIAQIQNIVCRELDFQLDNINITQEQSGHY